MYVCIYVQYIASQTAICDESRVNETPLPFVTKKRVSRALNEVRALCVNSDHNRLRKCPFEWNNRLEMQLLYSQC